MRHNPSAWGKKTAEEGYDKSLQNYDRYGWRSAGQCLGFGHQTKVMKVQMEQKEAIPHRKSSRNVEIVKESSEG